MAQFIVSQAEAIELIRQQFMLPTTVEVIIEQTTEPTVEDDGWIDVPADWHVCAAPPEAACLDIVEVLFGDGDFDTDKPHRWTGSWCQTGISTYTIVKFRPVK